MRCELRSASALTHQPTNPILKNECDVCVLKIFSILKRKNSGLTPYWKMSVSKRGLKHVLCIQDLDIFRYTPL